MNEKLRRGITGEGFAELLRHPGRGRIRGDIEMQNSSATMIDREPDIKKLEPCRGDDQEIHCREDVPMIAKEGRPSLTIMISRTRGRQVSSDGRQTNG